MNRSLRRCYPIALATILLASPLPALAEPGQLEINITCAVQTGCFPGDAAGFPVTISSSGAYRLTSNLRQTAITGFSTPVNAIEIASDGVHLDLGGFTISCSNPITGSCTGSAAGVTTSGGARSATLVMNGDIRRMPGAGIALSAGVDAVVRDVSTIGNRGGGISVGRGGRVERCTSSENWSIGIATEADSIVRDSVARDNGLRGIQVGAGSLVTASVANENGSTGIQTGSYSTVLGSTSLNNTGTGIAVQDGSTVANNTAADNLSNGITADSGSNIHGNTTSNNNGVGITGLSHGYRDNVSIGNSVGGYSGGTNLGGNL